MVVLVGNLQERLDGECELSCRVVGLLVDDLVELDEVEVVPGALRQRLVEHLEERRL